MACTPVNQGKAIGILETENEKLKNKLHESQKPKEENVKKPALNIAGWTLKKGKDGYYRAHKTIKTKSYGVYVGKEVTPATKLKIVQKENEILERSRPKKPKKVKRKLNK